MAQSCWDFAYAIYSSDANKNMNTAFQTLTGWVLFHTKNTVLPNFHGSSVISMMGFIYSIQNYEISLQTFVPSHRKCPTCPMIFVNTENRKVILLIILLSPVLLNTVTMTAREVTAWNASWERDQDFPEVKGQKSQPSTQTWTCFISMVERHFVCWNKVCNGPGPWFNIKMLSYQYRKFHCGDKTILWLSYLHNGISYTGKKAFLYWERALTICNLAWLLLLSSSHW